MKNDCGSFRRSLSYVIQESMCTILPVNIWKKLYFGAGVVSVVFLIETFLPIHLF
jgi:hypothetical protein